MPLSDLYSLFPYGQIKTQQQAHPNKSAPLLYMGEMWYRTIHRWTQSSSATIIDLVSETLYFFLISILKYVLDKNFICKFLLLTDTG
uniref:Uncharacterized protein n=1 Tax=Podoviridae sp. ctOAf25 TaxID=2825245 RepID=A0A8S5PQ95_9CAUD|nr:MAG TPA: hypothetical protein [Podoviridae sp. ctOAf25]